MTHTSHKEAHEHGNVHSLDEIKQEKKEVIHEAVKTQEKKPLEKNESLLHPLSPKNTPWYMHKHFLIGASIIFGLFIFAQILLVLIQWSSAISRDSAVTPTPAVQEVVEEVIHKDPAGFLVSYPSDISKNVHEENETEYAQVEFTHSAHPGGITIWVMEVPGPDGKMVSDLPTWIKIQNRYELSSTIDSSLGEKPALKFLSKKGDRMMGVVSVYDSLVWIVEATLYDDVYWQKVFNTMIQSYKFITPEYVGSNTTQTETSQIDTSNDYTVATEEEEIIE